MSGSITSNAQLVEEAGYRLLIEAVTDCAIYKLDTKGRVCSWSSGAQKLKGYETGEIIGKHFSCFYLPADCALGLPEQALATAAKDGRVESEGWRLHRDGSIFWAHVVMDAIRDSNGELLGFVKVTRDRTEQHETEEALRRSEQLFRLLVNGVTDYALCMLEPDGRVASWNLGAQRIKGYHPDEIIGQHFSCFYTREDCESGVPEQSLSTALAEGRYEEERLQARKNGSRFWANVVINPVYDDAGTLVGFARITRDITAKRIAQEELEQARKELFQSQKMESLGQLTGGIAHDFNNLLTVLIGGLQLLHRHLPAKEQRVQEIWQNALEATRRGAELTQKMLAFARKQRLFPQPIALPSLLQEMNELLLSSLGPTITIETRFPGNLKQTMSDLNQLELSIINLAANARDAMLPDGGTIIISARNEMVAEGQKANLANGEYICLSISDSGTGMDADTLRRSVEPFFTTKAPGKGSGLGLSLVHGIARQQGGNLVLHSAPGQGTTAEIWLPAVVATSDEEIPEPQTREGEVTAPEKIGLRVLVVDDDALVLTSTASLLLELGCQVKCAASPDYALQVLASQERFDLLITDYAMPEMDGVHLIKRVQQDYPYLRCILMSGYVARLEACPQSIISLSKPFDREQLHAVLNRAQADHRKNETR